MTEWVLIIVSISWAFPIIFADWAGKIIRTSLIEPHKEDLEPLVTQIIMRSLEDVNCIAVTSDSHYVNVFGPLFYGNIRNIPSFLVQVGDEEDLLAPNYKTLKIMQAIRRSGCQLNIIFMRNAEQVGRFLRFGDRHREIDTRANFIILHDRQLLSPTLHFLWKKIVNVIFIRKFASRPGIRPWYELFTVPYPAPIDDVLYLKRLDLWRGGVFKQSARLFRDKTYDLRGQLIRAVTFQHVPAAFKAPAPSVKTDVIVHGNSPVGYTGVEIEILTTLSRIMNFRMDVYEAPNDERWGLVSTNGSRTGVLGALANGHADIALGDLHHTPYNLKYMDLTIPYNTQCLTFLTPEARTDNSWQTLLLPFKGYLWTGVLISLAAGSITFFALAKFHEKMESQTYTQVIEVDSKGLPVTLHNNLTPNNPVQLEGLYQFVRPENSLLYTFSMLLLVSLPKLPAGWSLRVLTGCWWLYSILVVVAYRASMTAILANPAPRVTIDSLEQLAESKISVGGWDEQTKKFFQTSLDSAGKLVGSRFEIERNIDVAIARVAGGDFAFYENIYFLQHARVRRQLLSLEDQIERNNVPDPTKNRNLHVMSNCVINMPISIGLQRNSPIKHRVDKYLRLIIQGGLAQKWLHDAMSQVLTADRSNGEDAEKALMNLKKFLGALVALGAGYIFSFIAFIIEIIYWRIKVVRNPNYDRFANAIIIKKIPNVRQNNLDDLEVTL